MRISTIEFEVRFSQFESVLTGIFCLLATIELWDKVQLLDVIQQGHEAKVHV
jgi:hypothetical protein